ncbi:MAG TPA: SEL1-like repeat protein [Myxococcota bacterium]|nr:SEL1-like repeat protein [Myxococcota bacterium]
MADSCITNAQVALGWRYQTGSGVAKDLAEAVRWYRKAAQQGTTDAQRALDDLAASTGR